MTRHWHAATTKPLQEVRAERELRKQGFRVYSPRVRVRRAGGYRIQPYLRGYVLVQFDAERDWWWPSICHTRGVGRLLMMGERPSRIRRGVVERLIAEIGDDFAVDERKIDELILRPGDLVDVFGWGSGVVISSSHDRIRLMLETAVLGRRDVTVDQRFVKRKDQHGDASQAIG